MSIAGKVALVTGGGQGIGRAIALRLTSDGADVADLDQEKANAVAVEVRALGRKSAVTATEVSDRAPVARVAPLLTHRRRGVPGLSQQNPAHGPAPVTPA